MVELVSAGLWCRYNAYFDWCKSVLYPCLWAKAQRNDISLDILPTITQLAGIFLACTWSQTSLGSEFLFKTARERDRPYHMSWLIWSIGGYGLCHSLWISYRSKHPHGPWSTNTASSSSMTPNHGCRHNNCSCSDHISVQSFILVLLWKDSLSHIYPHQPSMGIWADQRSPRLNQTQLWCHPWDFWWIIRGSSPTWI
jgi:hypothetical protein